MKKNWFRSLFSRFTVKTVHICKCFSEVWSEFHWCISSWFVHGKKPIFRSLELSRQWTIGMIFLFAMHVSSVQPILSCESRSVEFFFFSETIVNSFKFLFETSPSSIVGYEFSSAVPSTSRSPLLDNVVLDWESIQPPLLKMLAGFTFFEEMSTSAKDNSFIPIKKAFWALHVNEDDSRSFSRVRDHESFPLVSQLHVAICPRTVNKPGGCSQTSLPVLTWSSSTFSSSSWSQRLTDIGTQLENKFRVLSLVLSKSS